MITTNTTPHHRHHHHHPPVLLLTRITRCVCLNVLSLLLLSFQALLPFVFGNNISFTLCLVTPHVFPKLHTHAHTTLPQVFLAYLNDQTIKRESAFAPLRLGPQRWIRIMYNTEPRAASGRDGNTCTLFFSPYAVDYHDDTSELSSSLPCSIVGNNTRNQLSSTLGNSIEVTQHPDSVIVEGHRCFLF